MGTSKSYISLKGGAYTRTKRALSSFINGGAISKQEVAGRFATTLKSEANLSNGTNNSIKNYSTVASKIISFLGNAQSAGLNYALKQANFAKIPENIDDLIKLFCETEISNTIDISVANVALQITLETMTPVLEDIENINLVQFTKELIANLISVCFEQRYFEEILKKCNVSEAKQKCNVIKDYIHSDIILNLDALKVIEIHNDIGLMSDFIEKKCMEALDILMKFYD